MYLQEGVHLQDLGDMHEDGIVRAGCLAAPEQVPAEGSDHSEHRGVQPLRPGGPQLQRAKHDNRRLETQSQRAKVTIQPPYVSVGRK